AFFVHISNGRPTAGCVGLPRADMTRLLKWLDPRHRPVIQLTTGTAWAPPASQLARQAPQGDFTARADNAGSRVVVSGWTVDHADLTRTALVNVRINGRDQGNVSAALPSPYLFPYGIPGNHGFATSYA